MALAEDPRTDPWLIEGFDPGRPVPVPGTAGARVVELATAHEASRIALIDTLRDFEANDRYADDGYRSVYSWLRDHTDLTRGDVARLIDTARFLSRHDHAERALRSATLALAKASALARVDTEARRDLMVRDLPALISAVAPLDVDAACRVIAQWARLADNEVGSEPDDAKARQHLHASRTLSGMVVIDGLLDAETGSLVLAALDALDHPDSLDDGIPVRSRSQRNAENLGEMARRSLASDGHLDPDRTVNVVIDADLIPHDSHNPTRCAHNQSPDGFDFDDEPTKPSPTATDHVPDDHVPDDEIIDLRDRAAASNRPSGSGAASCPPTDSPPTDSPPTDSAERPSAVDLSDLMAILTGRSAIVGHGPVNPRTIGRLLCDNWISRVVLGPKSTVLDLGRRARLFTPAQRRAIVVRDQHCRFGTCDAPPERCHVHHLDYWEHGGTTDIDNGRLYCHRHHHLVHEGGWTIHRAPDGTLWATHPNHPHPIRC